MSLNLPAEIADTPEHMLLAGIMAMLAGACLLGVVAIDVIIDRAERSGRHDATGRRGGRRMLLILTGVFLAIAFYHGIVQR